MSKTKFIRLSGWALIVGAFAWVLSSAINDIQYNNPYNAFTLSLGKYVGYLYGSVQILLPSAIFLTSLGILGLYLRYSAYAGRLGRSGLVIAIGGSASALLSLGLEIFTQFEYAWYGYLIMFFLAFNGLIIFGIARIETSFAATLEINPGSDGLLWHFVNFWSLNWARAKARLESMRAGETLLLFTDVPRAARDIPAAVDAEGWVVLELIRTGREVRILIER